MAKRLHHEDELCTIIKKYWTKFLTNPFSYRQVWKQKHKQKAAKAALSVADDRVVFITFDKTKEN